MPGKGEDRAEGLAKQSLNTDPAHPSQSTPDHQEHGDHTQSNRSLTGNDRRKGSGEADPDRPKPEDRYKP
jgi:hypothetical protein